jgi:hypothetical protein
MDAGVVHRYMARLAELGLTDKLSLLIGVVPLRSAKSARWIKEKLFGAVIPDLLIDRMEQASDPMAGGARICADIIRDLSDVWGSPACTSWRRGTTAVPGLIKAVAPASDVLRRLDRTRSGWIAVAPPRPNNARIKREQRDSDAVKARYQRG